MTTEPVRVLNLFTIMNRGGAETMVMNYYRNIDRSKVQYDFMVHRQERGAYDDEIDALGGRIYRMPPIRLDDDARQLLVSYRWPGNVRELKNITERISVIEETRDITADVLRLYLPNVNVEKYPVLVKQDPDQKIFNSEREILYQVLFDMKKDVNELKKLVHDIMGGNIPMPTVADDTPYAHPIHPAAVHAMHPTIQDAEDVEEETLSLEEVEKEMIRKALEKHNGRRKNAAADLKISERTLYRKIKEYNLE